MKHAIFLPSMLFIFSVAKAQTQTVPADSVRYYEKELATLYRDRFRSMQAEPKYVSLLQNLRRARATLDNYFAFVLGTQFTSGNYKKFNADNALSGFGSVRGPVTGFGIGFSGKKARRIFDFNLFAFGLNKKATKSDEKITTSFFTGFQFEWGYDFIKSRTVNFYPFAGFGLRGTDVAYRANRQGNPSAVNVATAIQNDRSIQDEVTELGYQAGVGFEYVLSKKEKAGGTLIFLKAGTNRPFKRGRFDIAGYSYDPGFTYGEWVITAGFKFFGR